MSLASYLIELNLLHKLGCSLQVLRQLTNLSVLIEFLCEEARACGFLLEVSEYLNDLIKVDQVGGLIDGDTDMGIIDNAQVHPVLVELGDHLVGRGKT